MRRWKGATMQKLHKNWGGTKELQLRKRISCQSFGSKFGKAGAFSSVGRGVRNALGEGRFQTSVGSGRWALWSYSHQ